MGCSLIVSHNTLCTKSTPRKDSDMAAFVRRNMLWYWWWGKGPGLDIQVL